MTRRRALIPLLVLACFIAQACTIHPVPEQPGEAIAMVANDLDAVVQAAIVATNAGLVDEALHAKLLAGFKEARGYLAAAQIAHAAGGDGAQGWVNLAAALAIELLKEVPK